MKQPCVRRLKAAPCAVLLGTVLLAFLSTPPAAFASGGKSPSHQPGAFLHWATAPRPANVFPGCSGTGCNGRDPYATDCAGQNWDSWWVADSVPVYNWQRARVGWLQLWYSGTCGTNWSRFVCTVSASSCPFIDNLGLFAESSPGCQCGVEVQGVRDVFSTDVRTTQHYLPITRAEAQLSTDCSNVGCTGADTHWE